jgi:hypothetical protein
MQLPAAAHGKTAAGFLQFRVFELNQVPYWQQDQEKDVKLSQN